MQTQSTGENERITKALSAATGLNWSPPPPTPSFLYNGYYTETEMARAPYLVRRLKDVAIAATGRSRAIVFERCSQRRAAVNIPKEVAEDQAFLGALMRSEP